MKKWGVVLVVGLILQNDSAIFAESMKGRRDITLEHKQKFSKPIKFLGIGIDSGGNPYPKFIASQRYIKILGVKGEIKRLITRKENPKGSLNTGIYQNEYGNNLAVHITNGYSDARESWLNGEYFIFDGEGHETLHIKHFDDNTTPIPSPSGDYAVGWPSPAEGVGGPPIFYDVNGYRNKWAGRWWKWARRAFKGEAVREWPAIYGVEDVNFSADGNRVVVGGYKGDPIISGRTFMYDANGNLLWKIPGSGKAVFSPEGKYLAQAGWLGTRLLSTDTGQVIWENKKVNGALIYMKFSSNGDSLLVASSQGNVYFFNAHTGKILWQLAGQSLPNMPHGFNFGIKGLGVTGNIKIIALAAETFRIKNHYPETLNDYLILLSGKGRLISTLTLPPDTFTLEGMFYGGSVPLAFSRDGDKLMIVTKNDLRTYKIHEK